MSVEIIGRTEPHDPNTPTGREIAARLTRVLNAIQAEREQLAPDVLADGVKGLRCLLAQAVAGVVIYLAESEPAAEAAAADHDAVGTFWAAAPVATVAKFIGVSEDTVWRLVIEGELPSFILGRRRLVRRLDALNLIGCKVAESSSTAGAVAFDVTSYEPYIDAAIAGASDYFGEKERQLVRDAIGAKLEERRAEAFWGSRAA